MIKDDYDKVTGICSSSAEKEFKNVKNRHIRKIKRMINNKKSSKKVSGIVKKDRWIVNMSDRKLTEVEKEVLMLGLNFVPTPTKIPLIDIVASLEGGIRGLKNTITGDLRNRLCGVLRRAQLPKDNLSREQKSAVKCLKNSKDIMVLPADKGNATVLMKSSEFHNKLDDMLSSGTYGRVKKDPTSSQESKICRILKKLKDKKEMDQRLYNKLRPCGSNHLRFMVYQKYTKKKFH